MKIKTNTLKKISNLKKKYIYLRKSVLTWNRINLFTPSYHIEYFHFFDDNLLQRNNLTKLKNLKNKIHRGTSNFGLI